MPFSLKHIPQWHALEIKGNGKNRPDVYAEYQQFMESIPERVQPDDYTYLIPQKYFSRFMNKFGFITTMTQTEKSIREEYGITPREEEILGLLSKGLIYKEVADKLFISVKTMKKHIYNIYEKLHVHSKVEAVNKYLGQ